MAEDLDIGIGMREIRLAGQRVVLLHQIHLGILIPYTTHVLRASASAASLTAVGVLRAGHRVWGVTALILRAFGASQGLLSVSVGDAMNMNRWGTLPSLTDGTVTHQGYFTDDNMPIYAADQDVVVSANGGLFDAVGEIELQVFSHTLIHRR